jgi:iron(III) transport system permease protein
VAAVLPIAYLGVRASSGGLDLVRRTLLRDRTAELVARSLGLAVSVTVAATVLGVALAWLTVRCDVPGRRAWQVACALPLAIPTYVAGFAYVSRYPGLAGFRGAWLVLTLYSYPYVYLPVSAALASLDPAQGEAARSLGAGPGLVFLRVTLRQVRPAIATGGLLVALYALSDFGAVSILRFTAFTRAIYLSYQGGFDRTPAAIYGSLLVAITVVLVVAEGRARGRARYYAAGSGTRRRAAPLDLGRWRWAAVAFLAATVAVTLGIPAATLVRWLSEGTSSAVLSETWRAAGSSLGASLLGAVVTALAALPIGLLAARFAGSRSARFAERASYAGHALPGIVIALSLVFFATRYANALYQRLPTLVFAYVVLFLPLAVAAIYASAVNASPRLEEVAQSLGTAPFGALRRVTAPLVAPGVGAGAALVFLTCMKELPATLLLRPTGFDTLATRVWSETSSGAFAAAAPSAALLIGVAAIPTWLLTRRTGLAP